MGMHRIDWCIWQPGVDDADQDWHAAVPNAGVDLSCRASCEREVGLLELEGEGRYSYRVVAVDADESPAEPLRVPQRVMVSRWDVGAMKWNTFTVEVKAS